MGPQDSAMPDVIFDLDGVLSTRDTFTALLLARFRRAPWRLVLTLPALLEWVASRGEPERHLVAARRVSQGALRGLDESSYAEFARDSGSRFGGDPRWVRGEVVELLHGLRRAGHRIVLATATERRLAESFLRAIGADWDLLVASEIGWDANGPHLVAHRRGADKLAALLAEGVDVARCRFYTDSFDDEPVASTAGSLVLVHPSDDTVRRYTAAGVPFHLLPTRPSP